uniref:protein translocase subunit SecF n=1 Tax=Tessaracoccus timonensis TaxID=2161816 RepID=UPI000D55875F|nr:protein translocase subunit SecF [Tessaracoccus timonensis]
MSETTKTPKESIAHRLYSGKLSYDFIKNRKMWFTITAAVVLISILVLIFKQLTLGIEFRGGTDFQAPIEVQGETIQDVRNATSEFAITDLDAQVFAIGDSAVRVQTRSLTPSEITQTRQDIADAVGADTEQVTYNTIGGSWGDKISRDAAIAVAVFIALVMLLISIYFRNWRMAVAAVIALAHDVMVTLGVYALVGFTVTPSTLIGILTILGYSLYDTVVVFDKVRENVKDLEHSSKTYSQQANLAINQVLVRSVNTTVIGVLPVTAMLFAGVIGNSNPLQDLGLALLVGMIAGAFSSIFIATPLLAWFTERTPAMREHRATLEKRRARDEHRAQAKANEADEAQPVAATTAPTVPLERRQRRTHQTRAQRKGKK